MRVDYKPTEKQALFHKSQDDCVPEVLFGGAVGGGKSLAIVMDALKYAVKYSGSSLLILRRTYNELNASIINKALEKFPRSIYKYNVAKKEMRLYNGSVIKFGYLESQNDKYRYQGSEFSYIAFDELTHFEEDAYLFLMSRLRNTKNYPNLMRSSSNPIPFKKWVKERFIDVKNNDKGNNKDRLYIQSTFMDNIHINPEEYKKRLELLPEVERQALMFGNWDFNSGVLFKRDMFLFDEGFIKTYSDMRIVLAVDVAVSLGDGADKSAIVVLGIIDSKKSILLDLESGHFDAFTLKQKIIELLNIYRPIRIGIEKTSVSWHFVESFKDELVNAGVYVPFEELRPSGRAKNLRIEAYVYGAIAQKKLLISNTSGRNILGYYDVLLEEAINFEPNKKNNKDDTLDALAYAIEMSLRYGANGIDNDNVSIGENVRYHTDGSTTIAW